MSFDWAYNEFTGQYYPYDRSGETKTVAYFPKKGAFGIQLDFSPLITSPVSMVCHCDTDAVDYLEVPHGTNPSQGTFRVGYEATGQRGTGFVEFNSSDNLKTMTFAYKHSGRILTEQGLTDAFNDLFGPLIADLQSKLIPAGAIVPWLTETPATGYLECNGASLLRASYPELFAVIGTTFGAVDGTHFNLPDLRGWFLRGWDHGAGKDPSAALRTNRGDGTTGDHVGTKQRSMFEYHDHLMAYTGLTVSIAGVTAINSVGGPGLPPILTNGVSTNGYDTDGSGTESRPRNMAVMFCIKYL